MLDYSQDDAQGELSLMSHEHISRHYEGECNFSLMTSQLTDKIPNPFEARRVLGEAITQLKAADKTDEQIAAATGDIVYRIKQHAFEWVLQESEALFKRKLQDGHIMLQLLASPFERYNWHMPDKINILRDDSEAEVIGWEKSLFEPHYKSNFNGLEENVAGYVNRQEAVKWWHRLGVRGTAYAVEGWKKGKIYPDFLILNNDGDYHFIETKGNQLDNPDSEYKQKVFEALSHTKPKVMGDFKVATLYGDVSFNLVYEDKWEESLEKVFS